MIQTFHDSDAPHGAAMVRVEGHDYGVARDSEGDLYLRNGDGDWFQIVTSPGGDLLVLPDGRQVGLANAPVGAHGAPIEADAECYVAYFSASGGNWTPLDPDSITGHAGEDTGTSASGAAAGTSDEAGASDLAAEVPNAVAAMPALTCVDGHEITPDGDYRGVCPEPDCDREARGNYHDFGHRAYLAASEDRRLVIVSARGTRHTRNEDYVSATQFGENIFIGVLGDGVSSSWDGPRGSQAAVDSGLEGTVAALNGGLPLEDAVHSGVQTAAAGARAVGANYPPAEPDGNDGMLGGPPASTVIVAGVRINADGTATIVGESVGDSRFLWLPLGAAVPESLSTDQEIEGCLSDWVGPMLRRSRTAGW